MHDAQAGFGLAQAGFGLQQLGLHDGNLGEGSVEAFLRGQGFFCAHVAFVGHAVQAALINALVTLGLFAKVAGPD